MEANGKKKQLEGYKDSSKPVKLIFQYPSSPRAIIKSGIVLECFDDSFRIQEKFDGDVVYAYTFLIEIKGVEE